MNRTIAVCLTICLLAACSVISGCKPELLSDANDFLKGFVAHEYLGFMGVIVTISLGSAYNVSIELNKIEERLGVGSFLKTRNELKHSAFMLIAVLVSAFVEALAKYVGPYSEVHWQSVLNSSVIITIAVSFMLLIDLTILALEVGSAGGK